MRRVNKGKGRGVDIDDQRSIHNGKEKQITRVVLEIKPLQEIFSEC